MRPQDLQARRSLPATAAPTTATFWTGVSPVPAPGAPRINSELSRKLLRRLPQQRSNHRQSEQW
jgi:hypothetical protein